MIRRIFGRRAGKADPLPYEEQKSRLESGAADRRALAGREDTRPEILYYLADDTDARVRKAVAANPATPHQADRRLTADVDDEVRCELARKVARLLPDLPPGEQDRLRDRVIELIEVLARDQLPAVRRILADELKSSRHVPKPIVQRLARDLDLIVAAPILEYSPLLGDEDLLEIIATCRVEGALAAISRRRDLPANISEAIVATLDIPAVASLLANPNAALREEVLDQVIDAAASVEAWHQPLVLRTELSMRAIRRIAGFVASSLVDQLMARSDLDEETAVTLARRVRERVAQGQHEDTQDSFDDLLRHLADLHRRSILDETMIDEAIDAGRRDFVIAALCVCSRLAPAAVRQVLGSRMAKPVVALVWQAGLSMRLAVKVQRQLALIPQSAILHARGGTAYPLSPDEMTWHLEFFALEPRGPGR
ncbi:DUF2336 domain-containing protein [Zavarzinia compransoris]|uniref:DUF2336 domain-containing protein n=1 Tax=Zavarzinia compransoris TaxID=1264899 RepID=A0A317DXP6_9PROT|nr:DUF2336 domain-containing protein [Zavarzinia compransoris]PWR18720.1 hypothetical protein DKG75_17165 [Zavarzinia compransoris]TDP48699.1 uncharacterized protein (DUF2336 family) [Zavarzinia compransoris]